MGTVTNKVLILRRVWLLTTNHDTGGLLIGESMSHAGHGHKRRSSFSTTTSRLFCDLRTHKRMKKRRHLWCVGDETAKDVNRAVKCDSSA